jgi:hypothetical protein
MMEHWLSISPFLVVHDTDYEQPWLELGFRELEPPADVDGLKVPASGGLVKGGDQVFKAHGGLLGATALRRVERQGHGKVTLYTNSTPHVMLVYVFDSRTPCYCVGTWNAHEASPTEAGDTP